MDELSGPVTVAGLVARIEASWRELEAVLGKLSAARMTGPRSADGWTVKDHVAHIAAWEGSIVALLNGRPRYKALAIDEETMRAWPGFDAVNEAILRRNRDRPLGDVMAEFHDVHSDMMATLGRWTDADLGRSFGDFAPGEPVDEVDGPIAEAIVGNTFGHYDEHIPWIASVVAGKG